MRTLKKFCLSVLLLISCAVASAQVTSTTNSVTYACNGVTTAFPVTFKFIAASDLIVTVTPSGGVEGAYLLGTDYTVSGGKDATGTVTTLTRGLCAADGVLKIARSVPPLQPVNFRTQGNFSPALHQTAFDRITMSVQDLSAQVSTNAGPPGPAGAPGEPGPIDTSALALAGSKTKVFYQTTEPVDADAAPGVLKEGDLWFDTSTYVDSDGLTKIKYTAKRYHLAAWVDANGTKLIVAEQIAAGAVVADKIAGRTITADKIATGSITANEIAAGTITADKLLLGSQALTDTSVYHMRSYAALLMCQTGVLSLVYPFGIDSVSIVSNAAKLMMTLPTPPAGLTWSNPMTFTQRGALTFTDIARDIRLEVKSIAMPVGGIGSTAVSLELVQGTAVQTMCGGDFLFYIRVDWLAW